MLVLTRRIGKQIAILPHQLALTVLGIEGDKVRIGIAAPASVAMYCQDGEPRRKGAAR